MQNNTLIRLLNSLDKKELKKFYKFLRSPFFNKRKDVIHLFDYYKEGSFLIDDSINKTDLFKKIYLNEVYDDAKMRHLLSYLTKLLKEFYAHSSFQDSSFTKQFFISEKLKQKGLNKDFEKEWTKNFQSSQKQIYQNTDFHYHQHLLQFQKSEFLIQQKRKGDISMQKSVDQLNIFYTSSILKQYCSILTHQKSIDQKQQYQQLDEVLETVKTSELKETPAVAVYYYSLLTLKEPHLEKNYDLLKDIILTNLKYFTNFELRDIYLIAINYCIKKLNSGQQKYIREAFEWYRSGLDKSLLSENGILSLFTYKNILNLGLNLKEFDWVENYLSEYKQHLNPKERENHFTYCQAVFYFNKPDYDRVLELIQVVNFENKLHQLDARRMLLRIYYERNEINALESLLDSFQTYIRRHKNIGYQEKNYLNLIRFIRKFLKQNISNKSIRKKLIEDIENTKALAERQWLIQLLS